MHVPSLVAALHAPTAVLAALITAVLALAALLPLRPGGGQHAGAGPGAVDVWQVRDHLAAPLPRPVVPEPPRADEPALPQRPVGPEPDDVENTQLYGTPPLYSYRALFREVPGPEEFDTIAVQTLEPPHGPERTEESALAQPAAWHAPRCDGPRIPQPRPPRPSDACHDYRPFRDDRPFRLPEPTEFELLLEEGISAALDPHPYLGKHRLRAPEPAPALGRAA